MRRLSKRKALTLVKKLDAFPKVPESCVESSASGGTVSLLAFCLMAVLALLEFFVYRDSWMSYEYEVDKDFSSKLRLNIDITVAMKCQDIGADVMDVAGGGVSTEGLKYSPVNYELTPEQESWQIELLRLQDRLRLEHALQDILFKTVMTGPPPAPPKNVGPSSSLGACRIHGHVYVNKVAGNLHILPGKSVQHQGGHVHRPDFVDEGSFNFSHRIDHLSFGEGVPGIINTLDGAEKVTPVSGHMFQYFVTIVPTKLKTYKISADTHQYSVTEREVVINHVINSFGIPGIFIKYHISSLMVKVSEQHMPLWKFLVRLCGIIGGVFSTSGMLHGVLVSLGDVIYCRYGLGNHKPPKEPAVPDMKQTFSEIKAQLENDPYF